MVYIGTHPQIHTPVGIVLRCGERKGLWIAIHGIIGYIVIVSGTLSGRFVARQVVRAGWKESVW